MKKLLKYIAYIIGCSLLIIIISYLGFISWLSWSVSNYYQYNSSPLQGKHTINTQSLRYQIGSYRLNIPANYVIRITDILPSTIINGVDIISVLWPDLEPYTEKNHAKFDQRRKITNKIFLSLTQTKWHYSDDEFDPSKLSIMHNGSLTPEQSFYLNVYNLTQRGIVGTYIHDNKVPTEFIYYPESKGANEKYPILRNLYAVLDKGHYLYSARCDGAKSDHSPWTSQHCESFLKYNDEIYVRYEFDFNLLKDWRQIEPKIKKLIAVFEQTAKEETKSVQ